MGRTLATGDGQPYGKDWGEAQIRLWGLADGQLVRQFTGHLGSVGGLAYSPDGRRLASGGGDAIRHLGRGSRLRLTGALRGGGGGRGSGGGGGRGGGGQGRGGCHLVLLTRC